MAKTKEISRRIKSIGNTKKITRAMEMVAAAKMRKAVDAVLRTRTYANLSWETVMHLSQVASKKGETMHPLLTKRPETKKVAIILITSNRGMCGGYNSAVIAKAKESMKKHPVPTEFILVGKKGAAVYSQNQTVAAEFAKRDFIGDSKEAVAIINMVSGDFLSGKYDKVFVAYTDFVNAAKQVPRIKQLLPVDIESDDEYLGIVADPKVSVTKEMLTDKEKKHLVPQAGFEYVFEPSPEEVLDKIIPRLLEVQIYQALLEANASEYSAQMSAMHQATEAATDMVKELTLFYNKARQAGITAEIAEISAGANALLD